jgi:C4-dicarboxylate transporter DctM subunit
MLFAALSGSSPATVVAIGSIVIAGMRQVGYTKDFAAGVICNAGTLGILIPPSIVMVVYAAATDVSVGRMFLAGVIPGLMAGFMLMMTIYVIAVKGPPPRANGWLGRGFCLRRDAGWGLFLIVIILGGIYGGIFTPTEAAAVAAVYAFFIATSSIATWGHWRNGRWRPGSLLRKPLSPSDRRVSTATPSNTLFEAGKLTIMLMFIIANALILKHVLTDEQHPADDRGSHAGGGLRACHVPDRREHHPADRRAVHGAIGAAGDRGAAGVPDCHQLGIDPIHLGIIMVVNMEIGMITPPVGLNLFVTSGWRACR